MTYSEFAVSFATALTDGEFQAAHDMLAPNLQAGTPVAELQGNFEQMVEYGRSPARVDGFVQTMDDWPAKGDTDLGWAYVSICGDDFAEAVTVVVTLVDGNMAIGSVEWGRP